MKLHPASGISPGVGVGLGVDGVHGIQSKVSIVADDYIFSDMPDNILVGRYHSWVVKQNKFPAELEVTAS